MNYVSRMLDASMRTDLKQLRQSKDFWMPDDRCSAASSSSSIPAILLSVINSVGNVGAVQQVSPGPAAAPAERPGRRAPGGRRPGRKVVLRAGRVPARPDRRRSCRSPSRPPSASSSIVGERERGTGEFLAHSPAGVREIYLGKLIASLIPGYLTTIVGFGLYSLIVNLIVGPDVGGWFFPTPSWWLLMLWVVPPFLADRPVDRAAPLGPGEEHGRRPAGRRA